MRFSVSKLSSCAMVIMALSCSTKESHEDTSTAQPEVKKTQTTPAKEEALKQEFAALPESVIIAVPLDKDGNELMDQAQMRSQADSQMVVDGNVESLFAAGKSPAKVAKGELDADSSVQSWAPWQPNQGYGYGQSGVDQGNSSSIDISNINNSNVNVTLNQGNGYGGGGAYQDGGYQGGYGNGGYGQVNPYQGLPYQGGQGYYSNYRPSVYSTTWTGNYWSYSRPWCFQRPTCRYYVYPRRCTSFLFCALFNRNRW